MPALKMKAKSTTTCKRDGRYPHVSQKSNKISKIPCSMVRVTDEMENLAISSQTSHNDGCSMVKVSDEMENLAISSQTSHSGGFSINEEFSEEHGNEKNQMSSNIDKIVGQDCHSFNDCSGSIVERDSLSISVSSSSDMMSYFDRLDDAHCNLFEAVIKEQIIMAPQVDDNNFPNSQMPDMLNSYVDETCLDWFSSDGITVSDDWRNYNPLSDFEFVGTNLMYDPLTLEDTIDAESYNYVGSCVEFQPKPDSSWFHFMCHQAKPSTEELDVRSSQFDSERVDYSDPETFIKNFLEISDESNLLPALVSKETSKRKNITLVLDLDETLIHSSMAQCDSADFTIQVLLDKEYTVYVRQRPFLRDFLEKVSEMFEIIIFTASKRLYAEKLLDVLDPDKKLFSRRVYRESCIFQDGTYTKDLTVLGLDLAKVFIIDNSPQVFRLQVNNGIPIESWFDDPSDSALMSLLPFLEKLVDVDDVRPIIAEKFGPKNN